MLKTEYCLCIAEMADFYEDYLVMGDDGLYHISPSVSPENAPTGTHTWLSKDATMDVAIAREVFGILLDLSDRFNSSAGGTSQVVVLSGKVA